MRSFFRKNNVILSVMILVILVIPLAGQDLEDLRAELNSLRTMLKETETHERNLLEDVQNLEREINLRTKLLTRLAREKDINKRRISKSRRDLNSTETEFNERKKLVSKQLLSMYKRGRKTDLEILLKIQDMNQFLVQIRYQKQILEHQNRNLRQLLRTQQQIKTITADLEKTLSRQSRIIQETEAEQQETESQKKVQKRLLAQVRQDKTEIQKDLKEKEQAFETIKNRIIREEKREKSAEEIEKLDGAQFAKLKGSLLWPVQGKITKPFGRWKHPISKTWHNNEGIDIDTQPNATIKSVARGKVTWIDWVRGRGTVVILDHGGFYYTVYGHLANVDVAPGEFVDAGESIGQVGDRQSLYGSTLHFMVWKGADHMNPSSWLGRL